MNANLLAGYNLLRQTRRYVRRFFGNEKPNEHLPATTATVRMLTSGVSAFTRPSFSDAARVDEYISSIYVPNNHLTESVRNLQPGLIIDIGANIGLSSLSLSTAFPSAAIIIGVEAEFENFSVLKKNYDLWNSELFFNHNEVKKSFHSVYAIASDVTEELVAGTGISKLPGGISASGTFRFIDTCSDRRDIAHLDDGANTRYEFAARKVSVENLFSRWSSEESLAIVKVDIEGGEDELFLGNCKWLDRTVFLTVEVHDYMGVPRASKNLVKNIVEHDFAIVPEQNVLHCYNRKLMGL